MKFVLGQLARRVIERIEPSLARPRVIYDRIGVSPYLSRYYLIGDRPVIDVLSDPKDVAASCYAFQLYLHKFHRGDDDGALHNHPWKWSLSFVLAGGYWEDRKTEHGTVRRLVQPFSFNFIGHDDFHRVDLLEKDAWTLFLVGPKISSWGFWSRGKMIPWRQYITDLRGEKWRES